MKRKEAAFLVAQAAIVVGVLVLLALPLQSANEAKVSASSTVSGGTLAFVSGISPDGLQLEVALNSSSAQSHGAISAQVEVVNTLNRNVSISQLVQNQNITRWNNDD